MLSCAEQLAHFRENFPYINFIFIYDYIHSETNEELAQSYLTKAGILSIWRSYPSYSDLLGYKRYVNKPEIYNPTLKNTIAVADVNTETSKIQPTNKIGNFYERIRQEQMQKRKKKPKK